MPAAQEAATNTTFPTLVAALVKKVNGRIHGDQPGARAALANKDLLTGYDSFLARLPGPPTQHSTCSIC